MSLEEAHKHLHLGCGSLWGSGTGHRNLPPQPSLHFDGLGPKLEERAEPRGYLCNLHPPPPQLWSLHACPAGCWQMISALRCAQPGSNPALSLTWGALGHPFPSLSLLLHLWCGDGGGHVGMRREAVACGDQRTVPLSQGGRCPGFWGMTPPPRGQPEALKQQMGLPTAQLGCKSSRTT